MAFTAQSQIDFGSLTIKGKHYRITGYSACHPERRRVEKFVAIRFKQEHQAQLSQFSPMLIALEDEQREIFAVVGVREAKASALFSEQYLDTTIEQVVSHLADESCDRDDVIEVGNFAARKVGVGRYFFAALTHILPLWGARWLVCTGTVCVVNGLRKLGMSPLSLAAASAQRLPDKGASWGQYYDHDPLVMLGEIEKGRRLVERSGLLKLCEFQAAEVVHAQSA